MTRTTAPPPIISIVNNVASIPPVGGPVPVLVDGVPVFVVVEASIVVVVVVVVVIIVVVVVVVVMGVVVVVVVIVVVMSTSLTVTQTVS